MFAEGRVEQALRARRGPPSLDPFRQDEPVLNMAARPRDIGLDGTTPEPPHREPHSPVINPVAHGLDGSLATGLRENVLRRDPIRPAMRRVEIRQGLRDSTSLGFGVSLCLERVGSQPPANTIRRRGVPAFVFAAEDGLDKPATRVVRRIRQLLPIPLARVNRIFRGHCVV
jgi:hypothetical protein